MPYLSIQQAIQQNPDYVKQNYPQIYSQYTQQIAQPGASLANTQQSTQTSSAEAANLQAQNPGIQAQAQTQQVQATQNVASLAAGKAIKNGMTLGSAIQTFGALGVGADDVFQKYLTSSPYGFPKESLTQLKNMGVSDKALGSVGDLSSFADRQNMRNAVEELRSLQDTFNKSSMLAKLPFGNDYGSGKVYEGQRQLVGQHLSSLIQGAPHAAGSSEDLMKAIPDSGNMAQLQPGEAAQQFSKAEQTLLQSKGYSYKDLGLATPVGVNKKTTGNDLLNGILQTALPTGGAIGGGALGGLVGAAVPIADLSGVPEVAGAAGGASMGGGAGQYLADILTGQKPGADVGVSAALGGIGGGGFDLAKQGLPKALDFLNPGRSIGITGNARDAIVDEATKVGKTLDGTKIFNDLQSQLENAKGGNLGQSKALNTAIQDAKSVFDKKQITPSQAAEMYKEADSGFTRSGIPKTPIQANIDRGLRNVLSNHLDTQVDGWREATAKMAKGYKTVKSPVRQGVMNAAKYGIPLAVGQGAGDIFTKFLGL